MKPSEIKKNRVYCGQNGRRYVSYRGHGFVQYYPMIDDYILPKSTNIPLEDFAQWAQCAESMSPLLKWRFSNACHRNRSPVAS